MKQTIKTSRVAGQLEEDVPTSQHITFLMPRCRKLLSASKRPLEHTDILPAVRFGKRATNGGTKSTSVRPLSIAQSRKPAPRFYTKCATLPAQLVTAQKSSTRTATPNPSRTPAITACITTKDLSRWPRRTGWKWSTTPNMVGQLPAPELTCWISSKQQGWQDLQMVEGVSLLDVLGTLPKGGSRTKKPSSTRKYICPKCGNSCRATKTINIICGDCMEKMTVAE